MNSSRRWYVTEFDPSSMPFDIPIIHPLTADRWRDLEDLFGPERGANSGCWCMWLRLRAKTFAVMPREDRKQAFASIVARGPPPGLLAYDGDRPIGWCAVGPRSQSFRFDHAKPSRPLGTADEPDMASVFAITCFFVRSDCRKRGTTHHLAAAAVAFAKASGAVAIDACAIRSDKPLVWGEGFVGLAGIFTALGFREIARRSPRRPLMRLDLVP